MKLNHLFPVSVNHILFHKILRLSFTVWGRYQNVKLRVCFSNCLKAIQVARNWEDMCEIIVTCILYYIKHQPKMYHRGHFWWLVAEPLSAWIGLNFFDKIRGSMCCLRRPLHKAYHGECAR